MLMPVLVRPPRDSPSAGRSMLLDSASGLWDRSSVADALSRTRRQRRRTGSVQAAINGHDGGGRRKKLRHEEKIVDYQTRPDHTRQHRTAPHARR